MKITLENGKEIQISEESYKALVEASKEEEGIKVPSNIAQYSLNDMVFLRADFEDYFRQELDSIMHSYQKKILQNIEELK